MALVRRFLTWLAPTRLYALAFVVLAVIGAACCFLPLVSLLGYESAAVFGVVGGLAVIYLTLHAFTQRVVVRPMDTDRTRSPAADFFVLLVRHELLLAAPVILLSLNAARVINCSYTTGIGFWLAIPVPSVIIGQILAWSASAVASPFSAGQRRWIRGVFCVGAVLVSLALVAEQLALQPPIVGHELFLGYFSGSIYDEALALPASLVWYRLILLAIVAAVLAALEAWWRRRRGRPVRWMVIIALVASSGAVAGGWYRHDLGISIDRDYIDEQLAGRIETEHFVIHFAQTDRLLRAQKRLVDDHEYRYDEMAAFFGADPARHAKIHSYVYPNRQVKGRLMGGRRTLVSKLWLGEMHILWRGFGDHRLAHELAHIFTEPFGAGPLALSMQSGLGVNMGLVEGAATAADWPTQNLSPHRASAALRRLGLAPDIRDIVAATGFWTQSSGRAYTLVGSFVRFLVDTYGIEAFKRAYPTGDFSGAYGKSAADLVGEWEAFVDGLDLSDRDMQLARYLFDRRTIFDKVCARQIGDIKHTAAVAARQGNVGEVRQAYSKILGFAPHNIHHRLAYARALSQAHEYDRALREVEQMLDGDRLPAMRAQLLHLRGDLAWRSGHLDRARRAYRRCLSLGVPDDTRRLLEVKVAALSRPKDAGRQSAFEYLLGDVPASISLYFPMSWLHRHSDDALAAYLVGRRLWIGQQWRRAMPYLAEAANGVGDAALADETYRMIGSASYFLGDLDRAAASFGKIAASQRSFYQAQADEWRDRIAWKRRNRVRTQ